MGEAPQAATQPDSEVRRSGLGGSRITVVDVAMIGVALTWGINGSVVKSSVSGLDPLAFNAARFLMATVLLFGYLVLTDRNWRLPRALVWQVALLGLVGHALYQWVYIEGISRTSASNVGLLLGLSPLVVTLWSAAAGTDQITRWVVGGTVLTVAGAALVFLNPAKGAGISGSAPLGDLIAAFAPLCWGAYTVYTRPVIRRVGSPLKVTAWGMLFGSALLISLGLPGWFSQGIASVRPEAWVGMAFSAIFALCGCYLVYGWAVQLSGGARTAIYINLVPIISAGVAAIALGEVWTPLQWAGAVLVVAGLTVAKLEPARSKLPA